MERMIWRLSIRNQYVGIAAVAGRGAGMFERIREDYAVHGRSLTNPALWAMALYRFGQWQRARRVNSFECLDPRHISGLQGLQ